MKAIVQREYGGAERWRIEDVAPPVPGKGAVLVRVEAAALDRGTWHVATGTPLVARAFLGLRRPRNPVPGRDVSGIVEAVGADVSDVHVGDAVIGTASGALAELAVVPRRRLAHRPAPLSAVDAAALPVSGTTALQAVRAARIAAGDRVLVLGASGGVGTYVVQLAVDAGAEVTGVCSAAKVDLVASLGATHVLDYRTDRLDPADGRYDVIVDVAGNRPLALLRSVLTPSGRLVIVGGEGGGRWFGGMQRPIAAALRSPFSRQQLTMLTARERGSDVAELADLAAAGRLRPVVDRTFPLDRAAEAFHHLESGAVRGKVVVRVL